MEPDSTPFSTPMVVPSFKEDSEDDFGFVRKNLLDDLSQSTMSDEIKYAESVLKTDELQHIKVYLRIRPVTQEERVAGHEHCVTVENEQSVIVTAPQQSHAYRASTYGVSRQQQRFLFNRVFKDDTTQQCFFDETVKETIDEFIEGQNCLIFSYGVTNSGKTYTIQGDANHDGAGILPRSVNQVFNTIANHQVAGIQFKPIMFADVARLTAEQIEKEGKLKESLFRQPLSGSVSNVALSVAGKDAVCVDEIFPESETIMSDDSLESRLSIVSDIGNIGGRTRYIIWGSFLEIYNEQLYDLLVPLQLAGNKPMQRTALQLRDDRDGRPYVRGLTEIHLSCAEEALKLIEIGRRNLHIASTRLNRASSRSHCIFTLRLVQIVDVATPSVARVACLSFCDLAGSERYQATCAFNERVKEAGNINSSLLTLGRCIEILKKNQTRKDQSVLVPHTPRVGDRMSVNTPLVRRDAQTIAPFRESKLTRIFQNFLCGEGRVSMIINISQCSNVFDETLHALKYSALARQVVVVPAFSMPTKPIQSNGKPRSVAKRLTSSTLSKSILKKRKTEDLDSIAESQTTSEVAVPGKCDDATSGEQINHVVTDEEIVSDDGDDGTDTSKEKSPANWKEQRTKMVDMIKKLQKLLNEERQNTIVREARIRLEVCGEMQKQLVRIENEYQEGMRVREEICEDKFERKMEIYMDAVQKSCKRKRPADCDDELNAGHVEWEIRNKELEQQLMELQNSFKTVSQERDLYIQRTTEAEFAAGEVKRKLDVLQSEAAGLLSSKCVPVIDNSQINEDLVKMRLVISKLEVELEQERSKKSSDTDAKNQIEELKSKITDMEYRHELTCRQLRRELKCKQSESSTKMTDTKSTITDLESEDLLKIDQELQLLKQNFMSTDLKIINLQQENCDLQERVNALQSEKEKVEIELSDSVNMAELVNEKLVSCQSELEKSRTDFKNLSNLHENVVQVRNSLEKKVEEANIEMKCLETKLSETRSQLLASSNDSSATVQNLEAKLAESVTDLQQIHDLVTQKDREITRLENDLMAAQEASKQMDKLASELSKKLTDANNEIKSGNESLSINFAELQRELLNLQDTVASSELSKRDAELKSIELEKKVLELQKTLTSSELSQRNAELALVSQQSELKMSSSQLEALTVEVNIMKEQINNSDSRERELKLQLSISSQLAKELQDSNETLSSELSESKTVSKQRLQDERTLVDEQYQSKIKQLELELSSKENKLEKRYKTINELVETMEKERAGYEIALRDAKSNETVIEQLKLTLSEQELTMQTQDRVIHDRDAKVKSLEETVARVHTDYNSVITQLSTDHKRRELELSRQIELNHDQCKQKDSRIKDLEKEIKRLERQKLSLEKDVCDVTSELKDCERKLVERTREFDSCQLEVERLKSSKELSAKSLAKDLIQRDNDLLSVKQQLVAANKTAESLSAKLKQEKEKVTDIVKMLEQKELELAKWRLERDTIATDLQKMILGKDAEIKRLTATAKTGKRSETKDGKCDEMEAFKRALSIKEQTIEDMRQQNIQLQKQIGENPLPVTSLKTKPRASKSRGPLRVADHNADVSMSILSEGSNAVDLDETTGNARKKFVKKSFGESLASENSPAASLKGRRRRPVLDSSEVIPESPVAVQPAVRELRSRRAV